MFRRPLDRPPTTALPVAPPSSSAFPVQAAPPLSDQTTLPSTDSSRSRPWAGSPRFRGSKFPVSVQEHSEASRESTGTARRAHPSGSAGHSRHRPGVRDHGTHSGEHSPTPSDNCGYAALAPQSRSTGMAAHRTAQPRPKPGPPHANPDCRPERRTQAPQLVRGSGPVVRDELRRRSARIGQRTRSTDGIRHHHRGSPSTPVFSGLTVSRPPGRSCRSGKGSGGASCLRWTGSPGISRMRGTPGNASHSDPAIISTVREILGHLLSRHLASLSTSGVARERGTRAPSPACTAGAARPVSPG